MSIEVMSKVWKRLDCRGSELLLALAIADIANDSGANVFPGVEFLAEKSRQSVRTVQRQLAKFRKVEWLLVVEPGSDLGGRRRTTRYRINPDWINGDILSGFPDRKGDAGDAKGCQPEPVRVTPVTQKGDKLVSPYPSVSVKDPSGTPESLRSIADEDFDRIRTAYPPLAGSQSWKRARQEIDARLRSGEPLETILTGVAAYAKFCDRTGKAGSRYVLHAATFFGPERRFADDWLPPPSEKVLAERAALEQLRARRAALPLGMSTFREPESGETAKHYAEAMNRELDLRKLQRSRAEAPIPRQGSAP